MSSVVRLREACRKFKRGELTNKQFQDAIMEFAGGARTVDIEAFAKLMLGRPEEEKLASWPELLGTCNPENSDYMAGLGKDRIG